MPESYHLMLTMRQRLAIPDALDGQVWHYRATTRRHPMHRHDELEVNLVLSGEAACLVNGTRHMLQRGSMIWLFPGQDHLLLHEGRSFEMWIGVFRPRLVRRWSKDAAERPLRYHNPRGEFNRRLPREAIHRLRALFEEVAEAKHRSAAALANAAISHLLMAAWTLFQEAVTPRGALRVHPAVRAAAELLRERPEAGEDLPRLAAAAGLSPSRLSHLFRQQTGLTITDYRNRQRIERFLERIEARPDRDMLSAALEAGFGSYAQFHRIFKQVMGRGPRHYYRDMQRGENTDPEPDREGA